MGKNGAGVVAPAARRYNRRNGNVHDAFETRTTGGTPPMTIADRDSLIALLDKLGSPDDAEALAAARALDAQVKQRGQRWDDILARHAENDDDAPGHVHAGDDDEPAAAAPDEPAGDTAGDLLVIERLLTGFDLSNDTREILEDLKEEIKDGTFTAADRRYVEGLQARLGKQPKKK
jgi:hypothetical protein